MDSIPSDLTLRFSGTGSALRSAVNWPSEDSFKGVPHAALPIGQMAHGMLTRAMNFTREIA